MGKLYTKSFLFNILNGLNDKLVDKIATAIVPCVLLAWQQITANYWLRWPQSGV